MTTMEPTPRETERERMLIGLRGGRPVLSKVINLCRRLDGCVVVLDGEVMVVEFSGRKERLDLVPRHIPRGAVTHYWRTAAPEMEPTLPPVLGLSRNHGLTGLQGLGPADGEWCEPARTRSENPEN